MDKEIAYGKLTKFCTYRDRCHKEVRSKLLNIGVYGNDLENIMAELIKEGFLDEERFARSFARGKFRMKQWGRRKIKNELRMRDVSDYCIKKALEELDEKDYQLTLQSLATRYVEARVSRYEKSRLYKKAFDYLYTKGYEAELIFPVLGKYQTDN